MEVTRKNFAFVGHTIPLMLAVTDLVATEQQLDITEILNIITELWQALTTTELMMQQLIVAKKSFLEI
jgi:hypothetical protein